MRVAALAPSYRLLVALVGATALAALWNVPSWLGWGVPEATEWLAGLQLAGPALAAALCAFAARASKGTERQAWALMAAGSLLYIVGNLAYIGIAPAEGSPSFPSWADVPFFLMAGCFGSGIFLYGRRTTLPLAINTYNFTLLYGAMIFGALFLLHHEIKASQLGEVGTVAAFLYPALWGSVGALSAVLLVLHPGGTRRFPFALLTAAMSAEGFADFIYATQLMRGAYQVGGWPHILWMVSAALIAWAAVEHLLVVRRSSGEVRKEPAERPRLLIGQAAAPAFILFVVLITGTITGAFGRGTYQYLAAGLTAVLTITVGLREYWVETTRRRLQDVAGDRLSKLIESEERLTSVLESTSDSVVVLDPDWNIRFYNQRSLQFIPELRDVGLGGNFWDLFRPNERDAYGAQFEQVQRTGQPWVAETYSAVRQLWVDLRVYPTGNGVSLFFRDISEERRSREELAYLAHHDFLTGLGSRSIFNRKLDEDLATGTSRAVLLIDLDFFKDVNDTLGHGIGDAVLVEVAHRVQSCAPEGALVARLGGDEFALVIDERSEEELAELGRRIIETIALPIAQAGQSLLVGASIGIASTHDGSSGADLFTRADIALYEAKSAGRGQARVFRREMAARVRERKALLSDLSHAAEKGELELVYQPLLSTASRRTIGFEALLRWHHPVRGTISPAEFIPLAEEGGLIDKIGEWALRAACAEALHWPGDLTVSVNVSTRQLADPRFLEKVVRALHETEFDHRRLELEVTESALLRDANLPILQEIADLGIRIALDDFGTGYSSLSYLQRFQFSKLKIDRSFIADVPHSKKSLAIVGSVVDLARTLGMQVTAEGVETSAQFDWVTEHCDQAQGYYIARPMLGADIAAHLAAEVTSPQSHAAGRRRA